MLNDDDQFHQELTGALKTGEVRAVDALRSYQWAALKATRRLNCVCQFIGEAETWAAECDSMPQVERASRPLHGLPISVKDNMSVQGYVVTAGSPKLVSGQDSSGCRPCESDALVVKLIKVL